MSRESQNKLSKKEQNKSSRKQDEITKKKKRFENPDSDDDGSDYESDEMDEHEYRKFLSKIFPSKHLNNKIKSGDKLKKIAEEFEEEEEKKFKSKTKTNKKIKETEEEWETDSCADEEILVKKAKNNKKYKKYKKNKKIEVSDDEDEVSLGEEDTEDDSEDDSEDEDYVEDDDDDDDSEDEGEEINIGKKGARKLNIVLTIGRRDEDEKDWNEEDYEPDYDEEDDSVMETEDEDEDVSTDDSDDDDDDDEDMKPKKKSRKIKADINEPLEETTNSEDKNDVLEKLKNLLENNPNDKSIQKCIDVYEREIKMSKKKLQKKEKKQKNKNLRIFKKIIKDKNTMNDFSFYEKLEIENQKKIIKELREINKITRIEKPYRMTLLESEIPVQFKSAAMKKINSLRYMEPGSGEFYKIKNWVDTFMRIPFSKQEGLPISIEDGVDKCHEFMETAQKTLDQAVYGLNDAKMQIMQMLGQLLTNPKAIGTSIAIHGPPGTGKTSLVKEGISKILNRPFAFIALGGATDSSFLEGHGYTYEGSTWGKIVQILIDSKCMNPVIYFDELDKISDTPKGEEIAGILTHLTDTSQNSQFHDKYFAEINFDLSKCLFIFSYNDESKVNPILKDRMYRIKTNGYNGKEKSVIANNYLLPKIHEQVRFNKDEIIIPNDVINYIVDHHCNKEDGVRNLKRCLEIIYTKLNLYRLMKPGSNLFQSEMSLTVEFPFTVTKDIVDKLIKKESTGTETWRSLYN